MNSSTLSLTLAVDEGVGSQRHSPAALPPGILTTSTIQNYRLCSLFVTHTGGSVIWTWK